MQHGGDAKRQEIICEFHGGTLAHGRAEFLDQLLFRPPIPLIAASLSPLLRILPNLVFTAIYHDWPARQLQVLRDFLRSPTAIYACMTLADEEMETITALDDGLLKEHRDKLWLYFAKHDDWVGDGREEIIKTFHPDHEGVRVVQGEPPHAFCISESPV